MKSYIARGMVWGNLWGGGCGGYPSTTLRASSVEDLEKSILKGIDDGSLDSGMGFESLAGAVMEIETIDTIIKGGKHYSHSDSRICTYGDIKEAVADDLVEAVINNM